MGTFEELAVLARKYNSKTMKPTQLNNIKLNISDLKKAKESAMSLLFFPYMSKAEQTKYRDLYKLADKLTTEKNKTILASDGDASSFSLTDSKNAGYENPSPEPPRPTPTPRPDEVYRAEPPKPAPTPRP